MHGFLCGAVEHIKSGELGKSNADVCIFLVRFLDDWDRPFDRVRSVSGFKDSLSSPGYSFPGCPACEACGKSQTTVGYRLALRRF